MAKKNEKIFKMIDHHIADMVIEKVVTLQMSEHDIKLIVHGTKIKRRK